MYNAPSGGVLGFSGHATPGTRRVRRGKKRCLTRIARPHIGQTMIPYPDISPDLLQLGPLRVRWYGIMYILGFAAGRQILRWLCRQRFLRMNQDHVDDLLVSLFLGMLVGARGLYMAVYYEPAEGEVWRWYTPFAVWQGGLAFHGGLLGMLAAVWIFGRVKKVRFWNLADALALASPVGLFLGRIGNFINAELFGRETTVPWAMSFPVRDWDGSVLGWTSPRHPSQIYEAIGEGLLALALVWFLRRRVRFQGMLIGAGVAWYGVARFVVEFFREKDPQMGYYFGWMTMGQILCALMILGGVAMMLVARGRAVPVDAPHPGAEPDAPPPSAPAPADA